ncbi:DUF1493 family protein [Erwinia sp. S63]|uniref:DUF1493 family protein n=1 Tax=Erwinia sp. S63 TaxID=2769341 RepID=UPI00190E2747|nr:DUF1493 family protein [Erwinia sp. S63]MBK0095092.1 DUF1493 family protein [Erwinia sp. S63]
MVMTLEQQIYEFIRPYAGTYFLNHKMVELKPETDLDFDLDIDVAELEDLMAAYFQQFDVKPENFDINVYIPEAPFSLNPFKKTEPVAVPDFTIGMLIESAKAGRWLYD